MAFKHGKTALFKVDNAGGTLVDLSAFCDSIDLSRDLDVAETSTFGSTSKTYVIGLIDGKISVSGKFDSAGASTVDAVISGTLGQEASVTFEYQASNASVSSTNPKYTGEAYCTSYKISAPVGDVVKFSAEYQITGAATRAVA